MSVAECRLQSVHGCGWMGPEVWGTDITSVKWYSSYWLVEPGVNDWPTDVVKKRKQLPRVVSNPDFYGSPRYDSVSILEDVDMIGYDMI